MRKLIVISLAGLLLLASAGHAQVDIQKVKETYIRFTEPSPSFYYVPDRIVAKLTAEVRETEDNSETAIAITGNDCLDKLNKEFGVTLFRREFPDAEYGPVLESAQNLRLYYILKFNRKHTVEEVLEAYSRCTTVEHTEPIGIHPVYERIPNDPYFLSDQWNFYDLEDNDVDATDVWDHETGDDAVILGLLDTGLQYNSRDLGGKSPYTQGNVWINWPEYNGTAGFDDDGNGYIDDWVGWDFVDGAYPLWPGEDGDTEDNEPTDFNGHGTHVGGIMGAITNNGVMVAGLAGGWGENPANGVKIMACRIGWSAPYGGQEVGYVRMDFAAQAIYYAVNNGASAINCSWGSSNTGGLGAAVDYAASHGVVMVAAAGNDGSSYPDYLGTRDDVLDVCATNSSDVKPYWSNYGTWVDVAAPGVDVISTYSYHYNPNYVAWISGTSQAAPHVTAEAGILKSYADTLTRTQIETLIVAFVDTIDHLNPGYEGLLGSGRINAFKAVDGVEAPVVTVIQPNGGEVLYIGQVYTIMWDASDNIGIASTTIEYSVDGGSSWMHIVDLPGNPEEYDWTVTGPPSSTCRMKVTCYDAVGLSGWDMSDEDFCPPYKTVVKGFAIRGTMPDMFALSQNSPNPFNPNTTIEFSLARDCHVRLDIHNLLGQKTATLVDEKMEAGPHSVFWNGTDFAGNPVGSGIYFYRLKAAEFDQTRKMMLIK
jgi:subtilisin family serine protease